MMSHPPAPALTPEMANRLRRALTADSDELYPLLQDGAPEVLRTLLRNRNLNEDHLLVLLKRRDLGEDLLKAIYQLEQTGASHRLKVALATHPATPNPVVLSVLPHLFLFELLNICLLTGPTPDQKIAAERTILQRLPATPLGNKIALARRAPSSLVGELLKSGEPALMDACLDSPRLRELSVLQFLNGPQLTAETISRIARHPRWKTSLNLKLALLKNPRTPTVWFIEFLPQLPLHEVRNLALSTRHTPAQHQLVEEHLARRDAKGADNGGRKPASPRRG